MSDDTVTTTRGRVLEASGKCSQAKETLKTLFPDVFKERWLKITNAIQVRPVGLRSRECYSLEVWFDGDNFARISSGSGVSVYSQFMDRYHVDDLTGTGEWVIEKKV